MAWRSKVGNLFWKRSLDSGLDEELQFHLDARTRDNIEAGMSPEAARQHAIRQFGNRTLAKELAREANTFSRVESVVQDGDEPRDRLLCNPSKDHGQAHGSEAERN